MNKCIVKALVFSGRPDPTWEVEEPVQQELERIWDSLAQTSEKPFPTPKLGYRGCLIMWGAGNEWFVFKNLVTLKKHGKIEHRIDNERRFEQYVISSAPEGLFPNSRIEDDKYPI